MKLAHPTLVGIVGVVALAMPSNGWAQSRLSLELVVGPHFAAGNAAQAANRSLAASLGLVHRLTERFALVTEIQDSGHSGGPVEERQGRSTDISYFRWALGVEMALTSPGSTWQLRARAGPGFSSVVTDPIVDPTRPRFFAKVNDDVFTFWAGLSVSRRLGGVNTMLRIVPEVYFLGSSLGQLRSLDDGIGNSGTLIGVPVQLGVRVGL